MLRLVSELGPHRVGVVTLHREAQREVLTQPIEHVDGAVRRHA